MYWKVVLLVFGLLVAGCAVDGSAPAAAESTLNIFALDRSESTADVRGALMSRAYDFGTGMAQGDKLLVLRFGRTCEEFYAGDVPDDEDAFALLISQAAKTSDPIAGTDYAALLRDLADRASASRSKKVRITVCGDGWNDFSGDSVASEKYRQAAKDLLANPKVDSITFWGIEIGAREEIRTMFGRDETKLRILGLEQDH